MVNAMQALAPGELITSGVHFCAVAFDPD